MANPKIVSIVVVLVIGVVFVWLGALNAFFVALFVLAGWLIGKFVTREFDVFDLLERFVESRGKRHKR
jgi:uncharacterized membrane protein